MKLNNNALVLEGGGIKCAYQLGALIALKELGYTFSSISGASFGALNAALYIEGKIERLFDFYSKISAKDIFIDDFTATYIENYNGEPDALTNDFLMYIKNHPDYLENKQRVSKCYQEFIASQVNVESFINSEIDFYLTALEINNNPLTLGMLLMAFTNEKVKEQLFLSGQIKGELIKVKNLPSSLISKYVTASANYPTFDPIEINYKYYLDGGIYNNVPYQIFLNKDYEKIVIIRTNIDYSLRNIENDPNVIIITPKYSLGSALLFTHDNAMNLIKRGYQETMEKLQK